jgi:hypothetical protein
MKARRRFIMERLSHQLIITPVAEGLQFGESRDAEEHVSCYRAPQLFIIGKAVDLVQGYSYGKYSDGYTGYYWER